MCIDEMLDHLIEKYEMNRYYMEWYSQKKTLKLINQLFEELPSNKTIAIRGGGKHTYQIIRSLENKSNIEKVKYIIDKNENQEAHYENITVIDVDELQLYPIDIIIISSFTYRIEMKSELYNLKRCYEIIDLYDYFQCFGLNLSHNFYTYQKQEVDYKEVFYNRKGYLQSNSKALKEYYLEKLIESLLIIRDFIHVIKYIELYIQEDYTHKKTINEFYMELEDFLSIVKNKLKTRKTKDIVLNWLDALRYDEINDLEYLSSLIPESIYFEQAYTVMPWTRMTMTTLLSHKLVIDDYLFRENSYHEGNCEVLKYLNENGYDFKYIGIPRLRNRFADKDCVNGSDQDEASTLYQWRAIDCLIQSEKPQFIIIHNLLETHNPFLSSELETIDDNIRNVDWDKKEMQVQIIESRRYLDKQLEWYHSFYSKEIVKIYMSDHGKSNLPMYHNDWFHTLFLIHGGGINQELCKGMFSYLNFIYILKNIIEKNDNLLKDVLNEEIKIQSLDIYNSNMIDRLILKKWDLNNFIQHRGIVTEKDKYIKFVTGKECYYLLPDEENNLIQEGKYIQRINELRKLAGCNFINIYEWDEFKETRRLYELLDIKINN